MNKIEDNKVYNNNLPKFINNFEHVFVNTRNKSPKKMLMWFSLKG